MENFLELFRDSFQMPSANTASQFEPFLFITSISECDLFQFI